MHDIGCSLVELKDAPGELLSKNKSLLLKYELVAFTIAWITMMLKIFLHHLLL